MHSPDFSQEFKLKVDASDIGVGAALMHSGEGDIDHSLAYFSRKLNDRQKHYSTVEKETLALILALQHFEVYVNVGSKALKVFTDHNPLKYLHNFKNKNRRLMNWSLMLQDFNIELEHVKGRDNIVADVLSRLL